MMKRGIFVGVFLTLFAYCAVADTETSLGDRSGEGTTAFTGLAQSPEANLFTGSLSTQISIKVPPGRKHMTPKLMLTYSSSGGPSPYGKGWDLELGHIERSTRWGVPHCQNPHFDEFVLVLPGGVAAELVEEPVGSNQYRPRVEQAYTYAEYHPATNSWTARDAAGITYEFGTTADSKLGTVLGDPPLEQMSGGQCDFTTAWALTKMEDSNGNTIDISWVDKGFSGNFLLPQQVNYGGNSAASLAHFHAVVFNWLDASTDPPSTTYRRGVEQTLSARLGSIQPSTSKTSGGMPRYDFIGTGVGARYLLTTVSATDLPPQNFFYSDWEGAGHFAPPVIVETPTSPETFNRLRKWSQTQDVFKTLIDMNGDGLLDLVDDSPLGQSWNVHFSTLSTAPGTLLQFGAATSWSAPWDLVRAVDSACTGYQACTTRDTFDITGDGIPDYINAHSKPWLVHRGRYNGGWGFEATGQPWPAQYAYIRRVDQEDIYQDVIDMTGDGLPDLVRSGGGDSGVPAGVWYVYRNTGEGFDPIPMIFPVPDPDVTQITRVTNGVTKTMVTDFNGDGLPDLLTTMGYDPKDQVFEDPPFTYYHPIQFHAYLNTGQGFSDDPVLMDGAWDSFQGRPGLLPASDDKHTYADVLDVNGDGLPDLVQNLNDVEWRVLLNTGGDLEPTEWYNEYISTHYWPRSPRVWPGLTGDIRWSENERQNIDMIDMNGDGFLDRVKAIGTTSWEVQLNLQGVKPDLLVTMENGLGGTNTIKYEPSSRFDHVDANGLPTLPFISWVVTGNRLNDGTCILNPLRDPFETDLSAPNHNNCIDDGSEIITKMHYEGGLFAYEFDTSGRAIREFRGFREVTQTDVFGNDTITEFEQGLYTKGLVSSVSYMLGTSSLIRREQNSWQTVAFPGGVRTQLWLSANVRDQYDGGATPLSVTTRNDPPDQFGNVTHTYTYGTNIPHEIHSKTEFITPAPTSDSPRDKPSRTYTWEDFNGNDAVDISLAGPDQYGRTTELLEEKKFFYDGQGKGNLVKVSSRLIDDQGDTWVDTLTGYDAYGNIVLVIDGLGRWAAITEYNADDKNAHLYPTRELNALQHETLKEYDYRHGKVIVHQGPNGLATAEGFVYDMLGRLIEHTRPGDGAGDPAVVYDYQFPVVTPGQVAPPTVMTVSTKQDGAATDLWVSTYFDALGRQRYQVSPRVVDGTLTNVRSNEVRFDYGGNVERRYQPYPDGGTLGGFTQYDYHFNGDANLIDPLGRAHKVVAPNTADTATTVYGAGLTLSIGAMGELSSSVRDAMGRDVQRTIYHRPPPGSTHQVHSTSETVYDGLGRAVAVYQNRATADIPMKKMRYDTMGRRIEMHDRDSGTWTYGYDKVGNLLWQEDPKADQHMQFCYDDLNRVVHKCSIGEDRTTFSTHVACTASSIQSCYSLTDAHYEYDGDDGAVVPNSVGRLTRTVDDAGETRVLGYDDRGRQTGVVRQIANGTDVGEAEFLFTYNRTDEVVELEYPDGEVVQTEYDASGQPKNLCNTDGFFYVGEARYDIFGRVIGLDRMINTSSGLASLTDEAKFSGAVENYRLEELKLGIGANGNTNGAEAHRQTYLHNARGQVTGITDWTAAGADRSNSATYYYDDLGQLITFDPAPTSLPTRTYQYDQWGNITQKGDVILEYPDPTVAANSPHQTDRVLVGGSYYGPQHDGNGNREQTFANGTLTGGASYDAEDRISSIGLGAGKTVSFVYDDGGQQKIKIFDDGMGVDVTKYYSQHVEVRPDGSTLKSYFFGGTRIATLVEDDSTWQTDFLVASTWESPVQFATKWGGTPVMTVTLSQTAVTLAGWGTALLFVTLFLMPPGRRRRAVVGMRLGRGPALLLAILVFTGTMPWPMLIQPAEACTGCDCPPPVPPPAEDLSYFHYDHLGSPLLITNGAGDVVEQIRYNPYGAVRGRYDGTGAAIAPPPATDVRYEFTGYEAERNSGLLYANARFLDTELGSFLTHDPMAEFWSPYSYVGWDPANRTDPTGMDFGISALIVAFVIGFAASAISAGIQGASFGHALLAGLVGGATAVVGATIGAVVLQPALEGLLGGVATSLGASASDLASSVLFVSGLGQASYSASQGDYGGLIGLGLGVALGALMARGAPASNPPNKRTGGGTSTGKVSLRYGIEDPRANPTPGERIGDLVLNGPAEGLMVIDEAGSNLLRSATADWNSRGGSFELHGTQLIDPRTNLPTTAQGMAVRNMPHHPIQFGPRSFLRATGPGQIADFDNFLATMVHEIGHAALNLNDIYSVNAAGLRIPGGLTAQQWEDTQMGIIRQNWR